MAEAVCGSGPLPEAPPGPPPPTSPAPVGSDRLGRVLARAAACTAALTIAGAVLGLVRDQSIAHLFGAGEDSDAFLVAWTVPEMASTLLIEDGMALVLVPAFSHALARRAAQPQEPDPVQALVVHTLPRLVVVLVCCAGLLMAAAPLVVRLLAPGLSRPDVAVSCIRLTAVTLLAFGLAGYFSAALRAHRSFVAPATIYVAYNVGIIGTMLLLHEAWGIRAAAAGVALGSCLMVLVQLPAFLRHRGAVRRIPAPRYGHSAVAGPALVSLAALAPIVLFTVSRQLQVVVERFLAAGLPAGAISHLNYAQKVAQIPMVLSLMICTVTFPVVAQAMADGDSELARRRIERDLATAALLVLAGSSLVIGYAPQIVEVLFQRGAFGEADTTVTAGVMRVYALGLLGQCLVGALCRPYFSTPRPTWYPLAAMAVGLTTTAVAGAWSVQVWGAYGIAGANALGISVTAVLLLCGLGPRVVPIGVRTTAATLARLATAAAVSSAAGWFLGPRVPHAFLSLCAGFLLIPAVFAASCAALRAPEIAHLVDWLRRKVRHAR
ncbi:murein biosynthesis integral membrane protein MurJ [Streptomyces luteolus]|uniref:Murein biosynthesis integral membrane protein MurJ n=1 Tax=Streptomyces luteolus TaxID=3043615 RepID=A0ABT6SU25_9ACTN|nr:murein biosynthesis integral membrane protein MurJ [Streptomyces sp. B-S-A12]MDI3419115.1 murein biosynthesis integral membrane protein MurJ [Streptomyces sp. B-S-A12]